MIIYESYSYNIKIISQVQCSKSRLHFEQICIHRPCSGGFIADFEHLVVDWESETSRL